MSRKERNLLGLRCGRLTVIAKGERKKNRTTWICQCDCGNIVQIWTYNLARGRPKSCGCYRQDVSRARLQKSNGSSDEYGKARVPYKSIIALGQGMAALMKSYISGADQRAIDWKLTAAQFKELVEQNCFYCGITPDSNGHHLGPFNGIDRIDSSKDYTWDNCVPCCKTCNYAKQSLSRDDFIQWIGRAFVHLRAQGLLELEVENA